MITKVIVIVAVALCLFAGVQSGLGKPAAPKVDWSRQLKADPNYFPIGVWMQNPAKARQYQEMGVNLYVNLWEGPTNEQLEALSDAKMDVFCEMAHDAPKNLDTPIIVGWLHLDEPDNAQAVIGPDGKATGEYGPPVSPQIIADGYRKLKKTDPTRPIMINLGQGVAWDQWQGRGVRTNHPEDYVEYLRGCDMASFDIYPVVASHADIQGKLEYVPKGVARMVKWSGGRKMVWAAIEGSRIGNVNVKPTARQIRSEVWMSIIHGARGIIYFVHQFAPKFNDSPILTDEAMYKGVKELNGEIHALAKVINSRETDVTVAVESSNTDVPIATMFRRVDGAAYLFAVAMRPGETTVTFSLPEVRANATVEVISEQRELKTAKGAFKDNFRDYGVHLYKIK